MSLLRNFEKNFRNELADALTEDIFDNAIEASIIIEECADEALSDEDIEAILDDDNPDNFGVGLFSDEDLIGTEGHEYATEMPEPDEPHMDPTKDGFMDIDDDDGVMEGLFEDILGTAGFYI